MEHPLKTTFDRLPALLEKNAASMMRRMVARVKTDIDRQDPAGKLSHAALLLRVGEEDLVAAFVEAVRNAFAPQERGRFDPSIPMSLDFDDDRAAGADPFTASAAAFHALGDTAATLGIHGMQRYRKDAFLGALKEAFGQSRMDAVTTQQIMPFAKTALDAELTKLYTQLNALGTGRGGAG